MPWRDHEHGRRGVSVAQLSDGESVTVQTIGEPFRRDTAESDDALHVPIVPIEVPDDFADMSGEPVEVVDGDEDEPPEYNIINSSATFFNSLLEAFPEGAQVDGQMITITARQEGEDTFSRYYEIEA